MSAFTHKFRWLIIVVTWAIAVFFAFQIPKIKIDAKIEALIPKSMESKVNTDKIEEIFGGSDMIILMMKSPDILADSSLKRLQRIDEQFTALPQIERTLSLFTMKEIKGENGALVVNPAIDNFPVSKEERNKLREKLSKNELVKGIVVSEDFTLAAIIGTLARDTDDAELMKSLHRLIAENPGGEDIFLGGYPVVGESITASIMRDITLLLPLAILFMLIILTVSLRDAKGVLLPLSVVLMSVIVSAGLIPMFGWKFALVTVLLPVMMIAIGNNYGIYLVNRYHEILKNEPGIGKYLLLEKLSHALTKPILLCALTTIAGVLALLSHIIVPAREVGLLAAIGIGWALIISLLYIPAFLAILPKTKIKTSGDKPHISRLEHFLFKLGILITQKPKLVLVVACLVTLVIGTGMFRLKVEGNTVNFFSKEDSVRITSDMIDKNFGGSQAISIHFEGDIKDPDLLKRMDSYETILKSQHGVGQVMSISSVIRLMSKALLDPGDPGYDAVPDTREGVAQFLELYSMSGDPEDFEQLVDFNYENAQMIIRIDDSNSSSVLGLVETIRTLTQDDPQVARIGGIGLVSAQMTDSLVKGQWRSTLFAIVIVCLLVMWIFNAYKAGILVLFPLGVACIVLFGIMGWAGIPFDPATTLITSVMIGCGVDYTVQYLWRQRMEIAAGLSDPRAVVKTLYTTGQAITFNALAVMIGFSPLIFSSFSPIRFFGLMMFISIFICLIGALILVPALTLVWHPKFLNTNK
jgi:hydrophobe/amphiphile efflux-3 (HAE3) family protein